MWSGDDAGDGASIVALASALGLGEGSGVYVLPRTPNGRGVAAAWREAGGGRATQPPDDGELGALIVSGDEAAADPRVRSVVERARFVLTSSMFMNDVTAWAHLLLPGTSYLERDGTTVNLEGRPQRLRRAVTPPGPDELVWLARLGERFGIPIDPWPSESLPAERAGLPPRAEAPPRPTVRPPSARPARGRGLTLLRYRSLFSGVAVERVPQLRFQRPAAEVELAAQDAAARGIANGDAVAVRSNGTTRELRALVNRRLHQGVVRVADEHAGELADRVEVERL